MLALRREIGVILGEIVRKQLKRKDSILRKAISRIKKMLKRNNKKLNKQKKARK
jgi:hypothetical protein